LGCQLAKSRKWIYYNYENHKFSMPGPEETRDTVMESATPSELELDSGNESTTDAATPMADCDDAEAEAEAEEMLLNWALREGSGSGI
jgi:hypothetical protein